MKAAHLVALCSFGLAGALTGGDWIASAGWAACFGWWASVVMAVFGCAVWAMVATFAIAGGAAIGEGGGVLGSALGVLGGGLVSVLILAVMAAGLAVGIWGYAALGNAASAGFDDDQLNTTAAVVLGVSVILSILRSGPSVSTKGGKDE